LASSEDGPKADVFGDECGEWFLLEYSADELKNDGDSLLTFFVGSTGRGFTRDERGPVVPIKMS